MISEVPTLSPNNLLWSSFRCWSETQVVLKHYEEIDVFVGTVFHPLIIELSSLKRIRGGTGRSTWIWERYLLADIESCRTTWNIYRFRATMGIQLRLTAIKTNIRLRLELHFFCFCFFWEKEEKWVRYHNSTATFTFYFWTAPYLVEHNVIQLFFGTILLLIWINASQLYSPCYSSHAPTCVPRLYFKHFSELLLELFPKLNRRPF